MLLHMIIVLTHIESNQAASWVKAHNNEYLTSNLQILMPREVRMLRLYISGSASGAIFCDNQHDKCSLNWGIYHFVYFMIFNTQIWKILLLVLVVFRVGILVSGDRLRRPFGFVLIGVYLLVMIVSYVFRPSWNLKGNIIISAMLDCSFASGESCRMLIIAKTERDNLSDTLHEYIWKWD